MSTGNESITGTANSPFESIFEEDMLAMALLSVDPPAHRWLRLQPKLCELLGYSREELLQLTLADIALSSERDVITEYHDALRQGDTNSQSYAITCRSRNGDVVSLNICLSAALDHEDNPGEMIAVFHESVEARLSNDSLAINEPLRALINNLPAAIFFKDPEGRYQTVNQTFCDWYAADQEQVLGMSPSDFFSAEEAKVYTLHDHRVLQHAEIVEAEAEVFYPDGKVRWIMIIKFPVLNREGAIMGIGAINLDVSDRKRAEASLQAAHDLLEQRVEERTAELRESEKLFMQAQQIAGLGHFVWDEIADRCLFASEEYARILGITVDDVLERYGSREQDSQLVHPDDRDRVMLSYDEFHRNPGRIDVEYRIIRPDGEERFIRETGEPVLDQKGRLIRNVGILQDITDQKQAEKSLKEMLEDLEVRVEERTAELEQRNIALEQFAYTVSHDLKSPLVTVSSFIGLLEKDLKDGNAEGIAKDMQYIVSAANQMGRSLDDLLELSRAGRVVSQPERISLSQLSHEVISILQGSIADRAVEIEIAPDMPAVHADRDRISDVLQNLLENAIKFCAEGDTPQIHIDARPHEGLVLCRIRDNGIGISPQYHEKVFGLFDRLDTGIDGSGVGLALVKRIIEVHNGKVWIESEGTGRGTRVCFTLPAAPEETP